MTSDFRPKTICECGATKNLGFIQLRGAQAPAYMREVLDSRSRRRSTDRPNAGTPERQQIVIPPKAENSEPFKRKPGRPRTIGLLVDKLDVQRHYPELHSDRGRANRAYAYRALEVLKIKGTPPVDGADSLFLPPKLRGLCNRYGDFHYELLAALGRVKHRDTLRVFAERICEVEGSVQEKIRLVRRWRQGFDQIVNLPEVNDELRAANARGRLDKELKALARDICRE